MAASYDEQTTTGPPHALDVEQAVLGACLNGDEIADQALALVGAGDFFSDLHQKAFHAIGKLRLAGDSVDENTLAAALRRHGEDDTASGGADYLRALAGKGILTHRLPAWAKLLRETAALRRVMVEAESIRQAAQAQPDNLGDFLAASEGKLAEIRQQYAGDREHARPRTAREVLDTSFATSWLWPGWIVNGHINLVAAPGDSGKSYSELALVKAITTGCDWPDGQAYTEEPGHVLFLDFEGLEVVTCERAASMGIPLERLFFPPADRLPYLTRPGSFDIIRELLVASEADYCVIDSWRRATPGLVEKDSDGAVEIGMELQRLCRDFGLPLKVVAHTRKVREGQRWEVNLDDVRGTSALTDMARCVTVIEKPSATSDTRRLRIEKSNMGARPEPLGFNLDGEGVVWTEAPHTEAHMPQQSAAEEAIRIALRSAPLRYSELEKVVGERGISEATMRRAIRRVAVKAPDGRWALVSPVAA